MVGPTWPSSAWPERSGSCARPPDGPGGGRDRGPAHLGQAVRPGSGLTVARCLSLFDAMVASRLLDLHGPSAARARDRLLHDRLGRSRVATLAWRPLPGRPIPRCCTIAPAHSSWPAPCRPAARSTTGSGPCCSACSRAPRTRPRGGRHKVFGDATLRDHPADVDDRLATPTRARRRARDRPCDQLGVPMPWPEDALTSAASATRPSTIPRRPEPSTRPATPPLRVCRCRCCSSARTTASASRYAVPPGWVAAAQSPGRRYHFAADGCDLADVYDTAQAAARYVRTALAPRYCTCARSASAHAGTDVESAYRSPAEIAADADRDPLLGTARLLVESGAGARRRARPVRGDHGQGADDRRRVAGSPRSRPRPRSWRRSRRAARPRWPPTWPPGRGSQKTAAAPHVRRAAARGGRPADARAGDQPHAGRRAGRAARHDRVRRGRRP